MSEKAWFVEESGKSEGPFTFQELVEQTHSGKINPSTKVQGRSGDWVLAIQVDGLFGPASKESAKHRESFREKNHMSPFDHLPDFASKIKIKRGWFGKYGVEFPCPKCNCTLTSDESEIGIEDICPRCNEVFTLSESIAFEISLDRKTRAEHRTLQAGQTKEQRADRQRNVTTWLVAMFGATLVIGFIGLCCVFPVFSFLAFFTGVFIFWCIMLHTCKTEDEARAVSFLGVIFFFAFVLLMPYVGSIGSHNTNRSNSSNENVTLSSPRTSQSSRPVEDDETRWKREEDEIIKGVTAEYMRNPSKYDREGDALIKEYESVKSEAEQMRGKNRISRSDWDEAEKTLLRTSPNRNSLKNKDVLEHINQGK